MSDRSEAVSVNATVASQSGAKVLIHETVRIHPTAIVEDNVTIGAGSSVWDNAHVRHDACLGEQCIVGGKSYIAYGVRIGHRVKINASVYICNAVTIEDGVMVSAGTVFTNDRFPRAATTDLKQPYPSEPDGHTLPTIVKQGATIGAHCTIGNDLSIGRFSMVGMASLVTRSVPDFHLSMGHPAQSVGCVCRCGQPLAKFVEGETLDEDVTCEACGLDYHVAGQIVTELNPPS